MEEDKLIELRISGLKDAAARARLAFFISIFACGTVLITIYNNYLQWNRIGLDANQGLIEWRIPTDPSHDVRDPSPIPALTREQVEEFTSFEGWKKQQRSRSDGLAADAKKQDAQGQAENTAINLSWLGIKLNSADLDVFGTAGLFLTSMYYLLCVRRMHLDLTSLADGMTQDSIAKQYIYLGAQQSFVLNVAADHYLLPAAPDRPTARGVDLSRWVFPKLTFLPFATMLVLILSDWSYVFIQQGNKFGGGWWWLTHLRPEFIAELVICHLCAILGTVLIFSFCRSTHRLQGGSVGGMEILARTAAAEAENVHGVVAPPDDASDPG
jgi:hypothetical protein